MLAKGISESTDRPPAPQLPQRRHPAPALSAIGRCWGPHDRPPERPLSEGVFPRDPPPPARSRLARQPRARGGARDPGGRAADPRRRSRRARSRARNASAASRASASCPRGWDVMAAPLDVPHEVRPILQTPFNETNGMLSPTGTGLCTRRMIRGRSRCMSGRFRPSTPDTSMSRQAAAGSHCGPTARSGTLLFRA